MDPTILVDRDIEVGRRLVQALDAAGFPVTAALWYKPSAEDDWRLMIASPRVKEMGPLVAYTEIQNTIRSSQIPLPLPRVTAVPPDDHLITQLRFFAGTDGAPFLGGTELFRSTVGDVFIAGAHVYRAERIVGGSGTSPVIALVRDRQSRVWHAHQGTLTFKDDLLKEATIEGYDLPHKQGRNGLTTHIDTPDNLDRKDGRVFGDVNRLTFSNGRLVSLDTIASRVRIEGLEESELKK